MPIASAATDVLRDECRTVLERRPALGDVPVAVACHRTSFLGAVLFLRRAHDGFHAIFTLHARSEAAKWTHVTTYSAPWFATLAIPGGRSATHAPLIEVVSFGGTTVGDRDAYVIAGRAEAHVVAIAAGRGHWRVRTPVNRWVGSFVLAVSCERGTVPRDLWAEREGGETRVPIRPGSPGEW